MAQVWSRAGIAAGLTCVGVCLALHGGDARALVVEVNGSKYDVTTVSGTYNDLKTTLSAQPWFGNPDLSYAFASAVWDGLGKVNEGFGPYFAKGLYPGTDFVLVDAFVSMYGQDSIDNQLGTMASYDDVYAQARLLPPEPNSVPGPLPLFGAMAGYSMSRRLRARIQAAPPRRMGC
jgi:hypothetical protein